MKHETKILEKSENPFEAGRINLYDPWENPLNSNSFNYRVQQKLFDEIIRFTRKSEDFSEFRVIVGDKGEGKTHILCTLRDRLIDSGSCIFIYIKPETLNSYNYEGKDVNSHIYYHILNQIRDSILGQLSGKQGKMIIATILNSFVIPFVRKNYGVTLAKASEDKLSIFNEALRSVLSQNNRSVDSLFHQVRNEYLASTTRFDHETVYYLFKFAIYNNVAENLVNLDKWLRGIKIGEKRINRIDKALSAIKTINDIIVFAGKRLIIVFDQFERTVSEKQIQDNLEGDHIKEDLYNQLDKFFNNIWKLMEEARRMFFIFSLREENWQAFKVYLKEVRSHLESRFSDLYVIKLDTFTKKTAYSILELFLYNLVYDKLSIRRENLFMPYFPYFQNEEEQKKHMNDYIQALSSDNTSSLEIAQWTINDYYELSFSNKKAIVRNFLEECARGYIQLLDTFKYKTPVEAQRYFPQTNDLPEQKYIDPLVVKKMKCLGLSSQILEQIKIYLVTLITECSFVNQIGIYLKQNEAFSEIDYQYKKIQKSVRLNQLSNWVTNDNFVDELLVSIQLPDNTTMLQLQNCYKYLEKNNWLIQDKTSSEPINRTGILRRLSFKHTGNFQVDKIENVVNKLESVPFICSVKIRCTANGRDIVKVNSPNYEDKTITLFLPHSFTKNNKQAKILLGLDKNSNSSMLDRAVETLSKWARKNI